MKPSKDQIHKVPDLPEHKKINQVRQRADDIDRFISWLAVEKGLTLCSYHPAFEEFLAAPVATKSLLFEYFGIDQDKVHEEQAALLQYMAELKKLT